MKSIKYFTPLLFLGTLVFKGVSMVRAAGQEKSGKILFYHHSRFIASIAMGGLTIQGKKAQKLYLDAKEISFTDELKPTQKQEVQKSFTLFDIVALACAESPLPAEDAGITKESIEEEFMCRISLEDEKDRAHNYLRRNSKIDIEISVENHFVFRVKDKEEREVGLLFVPIWGILTEISNVIIKNRFSNQFQQCDEQEGEGMELTVIKADGSLPIGRSIFIAGILGLPTSIDDSSWGEITLGGKGKGLSSSVELFTLGIGKAEVAIFKKIKNFEDTNSRLQFSSPMDGYLNIDQQARMPYMGSGRNSWEESLGKFYDLIKKRIQDFHALMTDLERVAESSKEHILSKYYIAAVKENLGIENLDNLLEIHSRFFQDLNAFPEEIEQKEDQRSGPPISEFFKRSLLQEQGAKEKQYKAFHEKDGVAQKSVWELEKEIEDPGFDTLTSDVFFVSIQGAKRKEPQGGDPTEKGRIDQKEQGYKKEKAPKLKAIVPDLLDDAPPQEEQTQKSKGTQTKTLNKPDPTDQKSTFQRGTSWYFFGGGAAAGAVLSLLGCWWVSSKSEDSSPQKEKVLRRADKH